ncbi:MBL fold metallo-hydrolase [Caldimonas sp. KR1-144]|uniref:MBL fold metallo-hydrolase n=1 Tax=Caldimonas sp. KR1-144 TaxID=3400911 RepID=UPI003C065422
MNGLLPGDVTVLERGWLSSNNILVHAPDGESAVLVDSGHVNHAAQTQALVSHALRGARLERLLNTHLHSDHCGGNATLQRAHPGLPTDVPPGPFDAVQRWDEAALSYAPTGQRCERFAATGVLRPGSAVMLGGRPWDVIAAPGHDPDAVMLFDAHHGVLVSADALWEHGFGVVFPELDGERAFDDVGAVLDAIERLPVALVLPGHGAPFTDVAGAIARARARLAAFQAEPARHARHAAKVLLKYHLMEERAQPLAELLAWAERTPLHRRIHQGHGCGTLAEWTLGLVDDLVASGAVVRDGERVADA